MGPLRARTWLIGLCPVWDPIGNPRDPVRLSASLLCRKVVQAQLSATGSMAPIRVEKSSKNLGARTACRGITHRFFSFRPVGCP